MPTTLHPDYFYTTDGTRIFYKTSFNKNEFDKERPLLVLNYGLVCNFAHWEYQVPFFKDKGFQILLHDYRGHFNSSGDDLDTCNFPTFAKDLNELLISLDAQSIFMFGHSMGVNVTLEYAKLYPQNLKGLVLISGTVVPPHEVMFNSNMMEILVPIIEKIADKYPHIYSKIWQTSFLNPIARNVVFSGGFNTKKVPIEFIEVYMKRIGELPAEIFLKLMKAMKEHDIRKYLPDIATPTLVIGGDKDQIIPNYLQEMIVHGLQKAECYIVQDGSHVPQADFPETINNRSLLFINENT